MAVYLFAWLHHLAAFTVFAALFVELFLIRSELTLWSARKLSRADLIYGVSAGILVAVGVLRVLQFEKGSHYYLHSIPFLVKMGLFALVGLVSIYPTRVFLSWRAGLKRGETPALGTAVQRRIARIVHAELAALSIIILCAVLMARGVGYFGD